MGAKATVAFPTCADCLPPQIHGAVGYLHKAQEALEKMPHYPPKQWNEADHVRRGELLGVGTFDLSESRTSI